MKVKKMIKKVLKDNYITIMKERNQIYSGEIKDLKDKKVLNSKIEYAYTDECGMPKTYGSHLVIAIK